MPPRAGSIAGYAYAPVPEMTLVSPLPSDLTSARTSNIGLIQESVVCGWSKSKAGSQKSSHNINLYALSPTTWLEVSHYWQVMIDKAQIDMKQCYRWHQEN